jgi:hypothetical protein
MFSNYWITRYPAPEVELGPGERFADATGTGDGMLQLTVGAQFPAGTGRAFVMEVSRWFPMQNDPGDFYKFLPATVVGLGFRFGAADLVRAEQARLRERRARERRWREEAERRRREAERRWQKPTVPLTTPGPPRRPPRLDPTGPAPPPRSPTGPSRPTFE